MSLQSIPPELILQTLEDLPLPDLISAYHVNRQLRCLVPAISSSIRQYLFRLAFVAPDADSVAISFADRLSYVAEIESNHPITIPEPYRTVLTEWPAAHPPKGLHWPHAVRFHATGFCSCPREMHEHRVCFCKRSEVKDSQNIALRGSVLGMIHRGEAFDFHEPNEDSRWELFSNPPRLHTQRQGEETIRFIRSLPWDKWEGNESSWRFFYMSLLRLSRYTQVDEDGNKSDGQFWMVLDGENRGQIHGWDTGGWYDGFEAENFLVWKYDEWQPEGSESNDSMSEPIVLP